MKRTVGIWLLMLLCTSLFATTWTWSSSYPNVTSYRYQINGVDEDKWVVVSKDTTSFSSDLYSSSDILFVEQSLDDGLTWSPSIGLKAVKEKDGKGFNLGFALVPFYEVMINENQNLVYPNTQSIGLSLELALNDLLTLKEFGFDICLDLGAAFIPWNEILFTWLGDLFNSKETLPRYYFDLMARINYTLLNVDFNFALGGGMAIVMCKGAGTELGSGSLVPAISFSIGANYDFTDSFFLGVDAKYHYDTEAKVKRLATSLKIGVRL